MGRETQGLDGRQGYGSETSTGTDKDPRISADVGQCMFLRQGSILVSQVK